MPDDESMTPEADDNAPGAPGVTEEAAAAADDASTGDASGDYRLALERLREALIATDATIDPALVGGENVAELDVSFARARAAAEHTARTVRASEGTPIGAAAPGRTPVPPRSAFEKIRKGLQPGS